MIEIWREVYKKHEKTPACWKNGGQPETEKRGPGWGTAWAAVGQRIESRFQQHKRGAASAVRTKRKHSQHSSVIVAGVGRWVTVFFAITSPFPYESFSDAQHEEDRTSPWPGLGPFARQEDTTYSSVRIATRRQTNLSVSGRACGVAFCLCGLRLLLRQLGPERFQDRLVERSQRKHAHTHTKRPLTRRSSHHWLTAV